MIILFAFESSPALQVSIEIYSNLIIETGIFLENTEYTIRFLASFAGLSNNDAMISLR